MNIQEYISSGIVESYVLGLAEEAERAEFEQMCAEHAEVRAARNAFELSLEQHALNNAVQPPVHVRNAIYAQLNVQPAATGMRSTDGVQPARVVSMNWAKYVAAAAVVLLVGSTVLNFYFFNQYKQYSAQYEALVQQQTELVKSNNILQASLREYQDELAMVTNPTTTVVRMDATGVPNNGSPDKSSVATVYWNGNTKDVFLKVNNLPQPAADKQYQLWAIVDGAPVDAGVFDLATAMVKLKNIPRAQYFAITLEQKGGSVTPQGAMYVIGKSS